jgi:hypothetical protein
MDFSLLQQDARNRGLRNIMAFGSQKWMYYGVIIIDPILRFSWIFLAIVARNMQHGSIVAFFVAVVEVTRRGIWTIFRVENEHCTNIDQQKASHDVPLPYKSRHKTSDNETNESFSESLSGQFGMMHMSSEYNSDSLRTRQDIDDATPLIDSRYTDPGAYHSSSSASSQGLLRGLSRRLANAHTEDFQRSTKPTKAVLMNESIGIDRALQSDEGSDNENQSTARTSNAETAYDNN